MEEKRDLLLIEQKNSIKNNDKFYEYINNLSELCKDAPRLFFSTTNENKRKLLKLVCTNPKVIGSKEILEPIPVFENIKNIQKLKKLVGTVQRATGSVENSLLNQKQGKSLVFVSFMILKHSL